MPVSPLVEAVPGKDGWKSVPFANCPDRRETFPWKCLNLAQESTKLSQAGQKLPARSQKSAGNCSISLRSRCLLPPVILRVKWPETSRESHWETHRISKGTPWNILLSPTNFQVRRLAGHWTQLGSIDHCQAQTLTFLTSPFPTSSVPHHAGPSCLLCLGNPFSSIRAGLRDHILQQTFLGKLSKMNCSLQTLLTLWSSFH